MEQVVIDDVEPDHLTANSHRRTLSDSLGTTQLALNHYRLASGEGLPGGLHAHMDQEEVFVVLDGQVTFETMAGAVVVDEGEAIRFPPGEFQSGTNRSEEPATILALGAPQSTSDIRLPADCPECGNDSMRLNTDAGRPTFVCPACESTRTPSDCPDCGHSDLQFTRSEGRTVTRCRGCESTFEDPPLED